MTNLSKHCRTFAFLGAAIWPAISPAQELAFESGFWVRVEDDVPFHYVALHGDTSEVIAPKLEGYSIDVSAAEVRFHQSDADISFAKADEPCKQALQKKDVKYFELISRPKPATYGDAQLAGKSEGDFGGRGWTSYTFEYKCAGFGRPAQVWVSYLQTQFGCFRIQIVAAPERFAQTKTATMQMLTRMREIDRSTFVKQFFREGSDGSKTAAL